MITKRLIISILIPLLLFVLAIVLLFVKTYRIEKGFFILTYGHGVERLSSYTQKELLALEKVSGSFTAPENNLGIIGIRFRTFLRINDDSLYFRLKESDAPGWYYENIYKVDQFQPDQLFPFGFPEIADSRGKSYTFEIESISGSPGNAIGINPKFPVFVSKYHFDKSNISKQLNWQFLSEKYHSVKFENISEILQKTYSSSWKNQSKAKADTPHSSFFNLRPPDLSIKVSDNFIYKKFFTTIKFEDHGYLFAIYLFPLLVYTILHPAIRKHYRKHRLYMLVVPIGITLSLIYHNYLQDAAYIIILFLWINSIYTYKIKPAVTFISSIVLLIFSIIIYYSGDLLLSQAIGSWVYLAISTAVIQTAIRNIFKPYPSDFLS